MKIADKNMKGVMRMKGIQIKLEKALVAGAIFAGIMMSANATIITFDDITTANSASIPSGYGGLNWSSPALNSSTFPINPSGLANGTVSGDYITYAHGILNVTSATSFDFTSVYLTSAWNNNMEVQVTGSFGGTELYQDTLTLNTTSPIQFVANYSNIDHLGVEVINAGTDDPTMEGSGEVIVMDNFTINENIPEPATLAFVGIFGGGLWFVRRFFQIV